jgi:hypothetical protein
MLGSSKWSLAFSLSNKNTVSTIPHACYMHRNWHNPPYVTNTNERRKVAQPVLLRQHQCGCIRVLTRHL